MLEVKKLDIVEMRSLIENFCSICQEQNITNNSSIAAMKMGKFDAEGWWGAFDKDRLVSVSGCHSAPEFENGDWRVLFRTATLEGFRAAAGEFSKDLRHEVNWSHILPLQKEFALAHGAKRLFFTTNTDVDGDLLSLKTNHFVQSVMARRGLVRFRESKLFYGVSQNIWEIIL